MLPGYWLKHFKSLWPNTLNANNAMIKQLEFVVKWNMQHVTSFNAICHRPGFCFYFWMAEKSPLYQRADWLMIIVAWKTASWYFLHCYWAWRPCHFPKDLWKLRYCKLREFISKPIRSFLVSLTWNLWVTLWVNVTSVYKVYTLFIKTFYTL